MKISKILVGLTLLSGCLFTAAQADGWSHQVTSPGQYTEYVYVPAPAHVQQILQAFNFGSYPNMVYGQAVNNGPLGNYNCSAGPQQHYEGDIGGGGYAYVYQAVINSGYSVTVITW